MTNYSEKIPNRFIEKLIEIGFPGLDGKTGYTWIPTYGEVFDFFSQRKGIVITLEPFYTFSLNSRIAYIWKVSYPKGELPELEHITEEEMWKSGPLGGSFKLTADDAIEFAISLGDRSVKSDEEDFKFDV